MSLSFEEEEALRDRICALVSELGMPKEGTCHVVHDGYNTTLNVPLHSDFRPPAAVINFFDAAGNEHYFDQYGDEVFVK